LTPAAVRGIDRLRHTAKAVHHVSSVSDRRLMLRRVAETLALAAVGGVTCGWLGVPAGYLSGAIFVAAIAALAGRPLLMPQLLTRVIFVVIGMSLGAVVTPRTLSGMASYPASIATLIVAMLAVSLGSSAYLYLVHRWRLLSAYLASSPGGMSQVLVVAAELGADLRAIAIVQTMRVVIIAVGLPACLTLLGYAGHATRPGNGPLSFALAGELAVLVVASIVVAIVAFRFRFPGGLLFGAMFASAALHGSGLIHAVVPPWVANTAMVALGGVIGARFANTSPRLLLDYLAAAFGSFAVAVAIATVFGAALIHMLALPVPEVMIAYAPGSVDAMMLMALALHLDPVFVGAHHVMRIIFVSLVMPLVARKLAHAPAAALKPPREPPTFQD
jgi:membrane AbrB-like protein